MRNINLHKGPQFSFGIGEKGMKFSDYSPGPAKYSLGSVVGKEGWRCSIYPRRPDTSPRQGTQSPGPGTYSIGSFVGETPTIKYYSLLIY